MYRAHLFTVHISDKGQNHTSETAFTPTFISKVYNKKYLDTNLLASFPGQPG